MGLPAWFDLATDPLFKEVSNFITPPKAGKITAIEGNGQVRVETDDPDGGDVLAWPLNGFEYAVDDVVYVVFAVNHPESAIVIGSKGSVPALIGLLELSIVRNLAAASTDAPVVSITQDHASDDQDALFVKQDGTGAVLTLQDGSTVVLRVNDGGRLDVYNILRALTSSGLRLEDDGGNLGMLIRDGGAIVTGEDDVNADGVLNVSSTSALMRYARYIANAAGPVFTVRKSRSGSVGSLTIVQSGDDLGTFLFQGADGSAFRTGAQITGQVDGTPGAGDMPGRLVFLTTPDGAFVATERMRIDSAGRMGHGVSSPQGHFHSHNGTGGVMLVTKSSVTGSAQVLIPNGGNDVVRAVRVEYVLSDGSNHLSGAFALVQGGTMSQALSVAGSTWTVILNANGELSVARTAGGATATITFWLVWQ